ncbi:Branched-chain amino acid ABC-type transport system, permease component [uncultured Desulfatiglans sp.]|uniref:Branched-chain amino acid ABC-type transport system, permease component n=1 Tax=Uncultured Desulfatiglans sp. TaxID=1748965 RepID=A0A653A072_UNCDX|nr:Branched-chain amino acid ABC-type transport system, permease component [uncultured Desulfatiglans sp.]
MFVGTVFYAVINSVVLALMAIGFNLTFGISGVANFAYGALYILAAFVAWMLIHFMGLPYLIAAGLAVALNLLIGALMYRFILMRVRGQALSEVIATFGIGLALLEVFRYLGFVGFEYNLPVLSDRSFFIAGTYVDAQRIFIVILSILLVVLLYFFTHYTATGLAFRGIAQDERTALTFGIDSDKVATLSVALGAGLAALAALVIIPLGSISVGEGYDVLVNALAVCIIGGLGSNGGLVLASFLIGFAQRFTDTYVGSHWTMIVSLAAILLVLVIKPSGLFGKQKELEERI